MIPEAFFEALEKSLPSVLWQRDVPMSRCTTLRIGGPADCLAEPADTASLQALHRLARQFDLPVTVMGNGSNLLVLDGGIRGLVIRFGKAFSQAKVEGDRIRAQSGILLSELAQLAMRSGLSGLEFAAGIPGTLGGAVMMNAGAYGGEMVQVLETAVLYHHGEVNESPLDALALGYRQSRMQRTGEWVLGAAVRLRADDPAAIRERMADLQQRRQEKQPLQQPSAGSFFKRPAGAYAAKLIEEAGLKGRRVNGAMISDKHAGFLVNTGGATADDVLALAEIVRETVLKRSGFDLEPEVRIVGEPLR